MKALYYSTILLAGLCYACNDENTGIAFDSSIVRTAEDFTDPRDNNTYHCIQIGKQIWMAENLRYEIPGNTLGGCYTWEEAKANEPGALDDETYKSIANDVLYDPQYNEWEQYARKRNGVIVMKGTDIIKGFFSYLDYGYDQATVNQMIQMYYVDFYNAFSAKLAAMTDPVIAGKTHFQEAEGKNGGYVSKYGFLYSYEGAKAAVPEGWRLPTDDDWTAMEIALGLSAEEAHQNEAWRGDGLATLLSEGGASGFNAQKAGANTYIIKEKNENFVNKDRSWYYWSDTSYNRPDSVQVAMIRMSAIYTNKVWRGTSPVSTGYRDVLYSVRCVKDAQ